MIAGGRTPILSRDELAELGFQLILYPLAGLFAAARAIQDVYQQLRVMGSTPDEARQSMHFAEFNTLIGLEDKHKLLQRFQTDGTTI